MTTPEPRVDVVADVRRMLANAHADQIRRLLDDIRRSGPIRLKDVVPHGA